MSERQAFLPREFRIGPLVLDLFHRDARAPSGWLALHPREFELLWRLGEARGSTVSRKTLLRDVWRLEHVPETNSLEVHVYRLRAKLGDHGHAGLVVTDDQGGYRIDVPDRSIGPIEAELQAERVSGTQAKVHTAKSGLDSHVLLRETDAETQEDQHDIPNERARIDPAER
ncbi:winged helix-turn-helix domain-containing protein [Qipengyuania sp. DSG2-2]|uniref:winged helix-turn-helix domain-containing protein n=1 Tax=Qipengyuania sp. DGS2-2 TaxID=3349631 RepID=UPI0036D3F412